MYHIELMLRNYKRSGIMDVVNYQITANMLSDMEDIKGKYRIDDDRFARGIRFALLISEGKSRLDAYRDAFPEETDKNVNVKASQFARFKWVGDIVTRMVAGNYIMFADKHYQALEELFTIGMNGNSEKNRVDALKAFIENTKKPEAKVDTFININVGADMLDKLESQLSNMASNSKFLSKGGEIIDVNSI